jgi:hypothetical protein
MGWCRERLCNTLTAEVKKTETRRARPVGKLQHPIGIHNAADPQSAATVGCPGVALGDDNRGSASIRYAVAVESPLSQPRRQAAKQVEMGQILLAGAIAHALETQGRYGVIHRGRSEHGQHATGASN